MQPALWCSGPAACSRHNYSGSQVAMGTSRLHVCMPCKGVWQGRACMRGSGEVLGVQHLLHCRAPPASAWCTSGAWQSVRPVTAAGGSGSGGVHHSATAAAVDTTPFDGLEAAAALSTADSSFQGNSSSRATTAGCWLGLHVSVGCDETLDIASRRWPFDAQPTQLSSGAVACTMHHTCNPFCGCCWHVLAFFKGLASCLC